MAVASDVYPHLLAFLVANGLTKTAKSFRKETGPSRLSCVGDRELEGIDLALPAAADLHVL